MQSTESPLKAAIPYTTQASFLIMSKGGSCRQRKIKIQHNSAEIKYSLVHGNYLLKLEYLTQFKFHCLSKNRICRKSSITRLLNSNFINSKGTGPIQSPMEGYRIKTRILKINLHLYFIKDSIQKYLTELGPNSVSSASNGTLDLNFKFKAIEMNPKIQLHFINIQSIYFLHGY